LSAEKSVRPKVLGAKPPPEAGRQSGGKKEGWGEFCFSLAVSSDSEFCGGGGGGRISYHFAPG